MSIPNAERPYEAFTVVDTDYSTVTMNKTLYYDLPAIKYVIHFFIRLNVTSFTKSKDTI